METEAKPSIVLAYSSPVAREGWLRRVPAWVIAVLLVLPVLAFENTELWQTRSKGSLTAEMTYPLLYCVALFIPGAVRRMKWRHIFAMMCLGSLAWGVELRDMLDVLQRALPFRWAAPCRFFMLIMAIGMAEWIMVRPRSWLALAGIAVTGAAATAILAIGWQLLVYMRFDFSNLIGGQLGRLLADLVCAPFGAALAWIAIPLGLALTPQASRRRWITTGVAILASMGGYVLFTQVVVYDLARRTVVCGGPLDRYEAFQLLMSRKSESDIEALWRCVDGAAGAQVDPTPAFILLSESDPNFAARLADLLQRKPSLYPAASAMYRLGRCEAMPVVLRFAFNKPSSSPGLGFAYRAMESIMAACDSDCTDPHAADFALSSETRDEIYTRLGRDPGASYSTTVAAWDAAIRKLNMPPEVTTECLRISHAYTSYWHAGARLQCARRQVAEAPAGSGMRELAEVRPADLNVPGTDALEREVERYVREVNAAIQTLRPIDDR